MKKRNRYGGYASALDSRTENRTQGPMNGHGIRLGVRVFLLVLLQVSVLPRIGFFGATPDLLLSYVTVLAVTGRRAERSKTVAVTAVAAGFLADTLGGVGVGLLALFYLLVGAVVSSLVRRGFGGFFEELAVFFAVFLPVALLREGVTLVSLLLERPSGFALLPCLTGTLLPEFFGTLLLSLPVFLIFRGRD